MDLNKLTLDDLVALKRNVETEIHNREDGFFYILRIRSFGSVTEMNCKNQTSAIDICSEYNGDNGIVDIYTNNKDCNIKMYCGTLYYIESEEKYKNWKSWITDKNYIERAEDSDDEEAREEFQKFYGDKTIIEPIEI